MATSNGGFIVTKPRYFEFVSGKLPNATIVERVEQITGEGANLICFCTPQIVPARLLNRFAPNRRHNFHPASAAYPGADCDAWATYYRATEYGAVAHQMIEKVDTGALVATITVAVERGSSPRHYRERGEECAKALFALLAEKIWSEGSIELCSAWTGQRRRRTDAIKMFDFSGCDEDERKRRLRAFSDSWRRAGLEFDEGTSS